MINDNVNEMKVVSLDKELIHLPQGLHDMMSPRNQLMETFFNKIIIINK